MDLAHHRVFITGGTRGIGLALAELLLPRCQAVAVCGRSPDRLASVAQRLPSVVPFEVNLGDLDRLPQFVGTLRERFGSPTILINNAGIQFNYSWLQVPPGERIACMREETRVNFMGPLALTALLLDDLVAATSAAIVNISSILALAPKRTAPVYSATKAALRSFTAGLRYQLAETPQVRVVEAIPPLVDTAMTKGRGAGKISPAEAAAAIVDGLRADATEIHIGKAKAVRLLNRLLPGAVARILRAS